MEEKKNKAVFLDASVLKGREKDDTAKVILKMASMKLCSQMLV